MSIPPLAEAQASTNIRRQVGVVAIGRNEGERLLLCLESAKAECDHVVYADSASVDGSVAAASRQSVLVVTLSSDTPHTAARGRREGLERLLAVAPDCRYVQFVDGDCILQPGWLAAATEFLDRNPDTAVVCGRRFEARPEASFYNRLIDEEWNTPIGQSDACGGDSLMRVDALGQVGSFRPDLLAGEEPELCTRLRAGGFRTWRLDLPMTEHEANITRLGEWWRRAQRGGFGYAQVWSVTRRIGRPLYARQMISALFWSVLLPVTMIMAAIVLWSGFPLLLLSLLWLLQMLRMSIRREFGSFGFRFKAAAITLVTKFAEVQGVLRYTLKGSAAPGTSYRASTIPAEASRSA